MFSKAKKAIVISLCMVFIPFVSNADTVILKNGKMIETEQAWEEGDQVKLYRFGSIVGYPKDSVERIEKKEIKVEEEAPPVSQDEGTKGLIDLETQLAGKRPPRNEIEKAGNATVTVKTSLAVGSGFFISDTGYILTNRHVVEMEKVGFDAAGKYLENEEKELEKWKNKLEEKGQFEKYEAQYNKRLDAYNKHYQEYWDAKQDSYIHGIRISLVDNTELEVHMVSVSKTYDLALLKLDGYKTPSIKTGDVQLLPQGSTLYAIGSPLNLEHSVTSGIFSNLREGYIQTNIPLNSGNSGGPMITEKGEVVGISTWKISGAGVEGLSFAIPVETALNEFKDLIKKG